MIYHLMPVVCDPCELFGGSCVKRKPSLQQVLGSHCACVDDRSDLIPFTFYYTLLLTIALLFGSIKTCKN